VEKRTFWLRRLGLAAVLLGVSELAWVAFGASELVVFAVAGLGYGLVRLVLRFVARSSVAERRRPIDWQEGQRRSVSQVADVDEYEWKQPRVARSRGR
jgi:hypothetical protein